MSNNLPLYWTYDLETYPNVFTACFKHLISGQIAQYEVSDFRNDLIALINFLYALKESHCYQIGFNNLGFDYIILHYIMKNYHTGLNVGDIYNCAQKIIDTPWNQRYDNIIWDNDVLIPQIDLFKIHHFDNEARRTSLKMLEYVMCSDTIEDLPYPPGTVLTIGQVPTLHKYNLKDVNETEKFLKYSLKMIEFREQLSKQFSKNYLNFSDKKIGSEYLITQLEQRVPGSCYGRDYNNKRVKRQTFRDEIVLKDIIFKYIHFENPHFKRIHQWLLDQTLTETKGVFDKLSTTTDDGFNYVFGTGGLHASIKSSIVYSDTDYELWDWDVTSFYPRMAIVNNLYPEHLTNEFCTIYNDIFELRKQHKKGTQLNTALKLALNGAYGDSNNKFSPFYDPQFTMSITINGQLLLCMLAQHFIKIPGLKMIQANTDGLTVLCPRKHIEQMKQICKWWESYTLLDLESVVYSHMFIKDVNNYIAVKQDGTVKRKGAYAYERVTENPNTQDRLWHQNHSSLIIPKAAEAYLLYGKDIKEFLDNHTCDFDFMLRTKVNRSVHVILKNGIGDEIRQQRITRYYVSKSGDDLYKRSPVMKGYKVGQWKRKNSLTDEFYNGVLRELRDFANSNPLFNVIDNDSLGVPWDERINTKNKSKFIIREENFHKGYRVKTCNDICEFDRHDLDYTYYINEINKLINPLIS